MIAGAVIVGFGALVAICAFYVLPRRVEAVGAERLRIGDCIRDRTGDVLPAVVRRTRCDAPHFGEVFATLRAPESPDYPGEEALERLGASCGSKLFGYAPNLPDGPVFTVSVGYPQAGTWADDNRSVVCVAVPKNERWQSIRS